MNTGSVQQQQEMILSKSKNVDDRLERKQKLGSHNVTSNASCSSKRKRIRWLSSLTGEEKDETTQGSDPPGSLCSSSNPSFVKEADVTPADVWYTDNIAAACAATNDELSLAGLNRPPSTSSKSNSKVHQLVIDQHDAKRQRRSLKVKDEEESIARDLLQQNLQLKNHVQRLEQELKEKTNESAALMQSLLALLEAGKTPPTFQPINVTQKDKEVQHQAQMTSLEDLIRSSLLSSLSSQTQPNFGLGNHSLPFVPNELFALMVENFLPPPAQAQRISPPTNAPPPPSFLTLLGKLSEKSQP